MMVGHGAVTLPVPDGTPLGGYADRTGLSQGTIDDLQVRALVFADEVGVTFALVVCDVVCVNADVVSECLAALRSIGVDEAWICATHTHSGPETGCQPGGAVTPPPWRDVLTELVVTAVRSALSALAPTVAAVHPCVVSDVAGIRSLPANLTDVPVEVVTLRGADQTLQGLLVVVPIHSTVLPASNLAVSADLIGGIRTHLERMTGTWAVVAAGAAGDISTRHGRRDQSVGEVERLSAVIGLQIQRAVARAARTVVDDTARIAVAHRSIGVRAMEASERRVLLARAAAVLDTAGEDDSRSQDTLRQALRMAGALAGDAGTVVELAVVRLGSLALCAVPGEPFLASAQQLSLRTQAETVLLGYTNGYYGYFPTTDRFTTPSYEVLTTAFERGTAERVVDGLVDMVGKAPAPADR